MIWSSDGKIIRQNGNQYFTEEGIFRKVGNNLYGDKI